MPKKLGNHYIHLSQQFIASEITKQKYRMSKKAFSRNRKLTFSELSLCMMQLLRQNIQVELQRFFSILKGGIYSYTSSAFVQSRKKLNPDMFYDLNRIVAEDFYQDNDETVELYKGHRLLSIDGSTVSLPVNADTKKYPISDFKELYHQRWRVGTYYDRFKNIISVESFSGTSSQFIQQEFNCALYMSNLQSILTKEAQQQANEKYEHRQYEYKINASLSLCFIRNRLVELVTSKQDDGTIMEELKTLFVTNVIPVRPNRSFPRKPDKYRQRAKPKQFSNRRIVL